MGQVNGQQGPSLGYAWGIPYQPPNVDHQGQQPFISPSANGVAASVVAHTASANNGASERGSSGVHSPMAQILGQVEEYVGSSNV